MPRTHAVSSCLRRPRNEIFRKDKGLPLPLQAWAELILACIPRPGYQDWELPWPKYRTQGILVHISPTVPFRPHETRAQEKNSQA